MCCVIPFYHHAIIVLPACYHHFMLHYCIIARRYRYITAAFVIETAAFRAERRHSGEALF